MFFLLIVVLVLSLSYYFWAKMQYFTSRGVKNPRPLPLLGNMAEITFKRKYIDVALQIEYNNFKDERLFGWYQYMVPTIVVRDLDLLKQIYVQNFNVFYDRGVHMSTDNDPLFGRNIIMLKGSKWREMRAALSPAFSNARRRAMTQLISVHVNNVIEYLNEATAEKSHMPVNDISLAYVHDVIASCAFGLEVNSFKHRDNFIFRLSKKAVLEESTQLLKFFWCENSKLLLKLLNIKIIKTPYAEQLSQLFKSVLNDRRKNVVNRADIVQLLIDGKNKINNKAMNNNQENKELLVDEDLVAQAVVFFSAGFDTTANFINYFCAEMAAHPQILERLQAELDTVNDDGNLFDQIQKLEYLDMCISEVLRLFPPLGFTSRRSSEVYDFGPIQEGGKQHFVGPAGIHVWIPIHAIHHDEKYWPNPDVFDPERFSSENKDKIVPFSYMPFGLGPRNCIGDRFALLAGKVLLVELLRKFDLRAPQLSRHTFRSDFFVLRPAEGFSNIVIEPRKLKKTEIN